MSHPTHHLFLSYSRRDNHPDQDGGEGWITAFQRRLKATHQNYSSRELRIFFDTEEIDDGSDWRGRLGQGLRSSRLFIAFLSPNYIRSPNCRWEFTEYLRREHTQARGDDGVATIYFEIVPGMPQAEEDASESQLRNLDLLRQEFAADQEIARWLDEITNEMQRRNLYLHPNQSDDVMGSRKLNPRAAFDLRPWFSSGPRVLQQLDAAERLKQLRQSPIDDTDDILRLDEQLTELDKRIATRLDRCLLAELAPGLHSLGRSYPHFVGRHRELRELHQTLIADKVGVVTAVHGLGGQGKTALAIQYAHAYAEFYAAGGRWLVLCEGVESMAEALLLLAREPELGIEIPQEIQGQPELAARYVLQQLEAFTRRNSEQLQMRLADHPDRMSGESERLPEAEPRCLVIFDNVDQPSLLSADQVSLLPQSEWFETVITTRLTPNSFGVKSDLRSIPVDSLPIEDAVALVAEYQPDGKFASVEDEAGARKLCEQLSGFTLAVELAAAYLGAHPEIRPTDYVESLQSNGLLAVDRVADDDETAAMIRHREKQLQVVIEATIARLDPVALQVLKYAALSTPDWLVTDWLKTAADVSQRTDSASPDPWIQTWKQLSGLRLLRAVVDEDSDNSLDSTRLKPTTQVPRMAKVHRLVAAYVLKRCIEPEEHESFLDRIIEVNHSACMNFQESWRHDPSQLWQTRPLWENALHLLSVRNDSTELAINCGVLSQLESTTGDLMLAGRMLEMASATLSRRFERSPEDEFAIRTLATVQTDIGDFYLARGGSGDAERALEMFQKSLQMDEQLLEANANSAQAARNVSVSLKRIGDFYLARGSSGDAERALEIFQKSHETLQQLLKSNPNSSQAARDVSVSLNKLGDFYLARGSSGDAERALEMFQKSLRMEEQLLEANPNSAQAARDVSVSLNRLGDFYLKRGLSGDAERALEMFQKSLRMDEQLLEANPNSAQAARDVSISLERLGDFYLTRGRSGDAERALEMFQKSLQTREQLLKSNLNSAQAARDVSVSLNKLGDFYLARGSSSDAERALEMFQKSLQTREQLLGANPNSAEAVDDFATSQERVAKTHRGQKRWEEAQVHLEKSLAARKQLFLNNPHSVYSARRLAVLRYQIVQLSVESGNHVYAIEQMRAFIELVDQCIANGLQFDDPILQIYKQFKSILEENSE